MKLLTRSKKALILSIGLLAVSTPVKAEGFLRTTADWVAMKVINTNGFTRLLHEILTLEEMIINGEQVEQLCLKTIQVDLQNKGNGHFVEFLHELAKLDLDEFFDDAKTPEKTRREIALELAQKCGINKSELMRIVALLTKWEGKDHVLKSVLRKTYEVNFDTGA